MWLSGGQLVERSWSRIGGKKYAQETATSQRVRVRLMSVLTCLAGQEHRFEMSINNLH